MKLNLTLIAIAFCTFVYGQSNEIGLIPFKIEKTSETFSKTLEPKFTGGVYYNRFFEKFHWTTEFIIAKNRINDYCKNCGGTAQGTGVYREVSLASGLGLRVHGEKHSGLTGNVRLLLYGAFTGYSGTFLSSQFAGYFDLDNQFLLLGAQVQYSLSYTFDSGLLLGADFAIKQSSTRPILTELSALSSYIPPFIRMVTLPSLRIGYQF